MSQREGVVIPLFGESIDAPETSVSSLDPASSGKPHRFARMDGAMALMCCGVKIWGELLDRHPQGEPCRRCWPGHASQPSGTPGLAAAPIAPQRAVQAGDNSNSEDEG